MCGRFNLAVDDTSLDAEFGVRRWPARSPRYNIAPTQGVLAIKMGVNDPQWVSWGLVPRWAPDASGAARMINARSETVLEKPAFRGLVKTRRCLVPATGFYEWQAVPGQPKKPWHFRRADQRPFAFAGLWESREGPGGTVLETCAILTMEAPGWMRPWHHRCPVMLKGDLAGAWLDPGVVLRDSLAMFLVAWERTMVEVHPVSTRVNSAAQDDPECARPVEGDGTFHQAPSRPAQGELFG